MTNPSADPRPEVGVYCELDCLVDTRLSTLYDVLPDLVPAVLAKGYTKRDRDEFQAISQTEFKFLYDNRTSETLANAPATPVVRMVKEMCLKLMGNAASTPHLSGTALTINIHPYKLTDDEIRFLIASMADTMKGYVDVRIIDMGPAMLTPAYCNQHFGAMFMYDCGPWLDVHAKSEAFKHDPMTGVTLFIPMILHSPPPDEETKNLMTQTGMNPFRSFEIQASPFLTVNSLITEMFSVDLEIYNKVPEPPVQSTAPE